MKHIILTLLMAVLSSPLYAQRSSALNVLTYEDLTQDNAIYRTAGEWAEVLIQTKKSNPLRFTSNVDANISHISSKFSENEIPKRQSAIIYKVDDEGGNLIYHIIFRTDKKYAKRMLTVSNSRYATVGIDLTGLTKKRKFYFRVYNPTDTEDGTCFQEHFLKGNNYYDNFRYAAAKEEYLLAMQCFEAKPEEKEAAQQAINNCTAIMTMIEQGNKLANEEKYVEATGIFLKAHAMNQLDTYLYNRYDYCLRNQNSVCAIYMAEAENSFREKDYETAKELYQAVVDNGCEVQIDALKRINGCDLLMRKRVNTERCAFIDFGNTFGLGYANLTDHVGMYASLRINNPAIRLARQEFNIDEIAKLDFSLGLTIPLLKKKVLSKLRSKVFKGVWLNVGAGVTGSNKFEVNSTLLEDEYWGPKFKGTLTQEAIEKFIDDYKTSDHKLKNDYTDPSDVLKAKYGATANGELGLTVKVWCIALHGTYCHRWGIAQTRDYIDLIGKNAFSFGIGYCW